MEEEVESVILFFRSAGARSAGTANGSKVVIGEAKDARGVRNPGV